MQSMQVIEQQDQGCRLVYWELPDHGWEDVARRIDPFLARAIHRIAAEYVGEPVPWLEVNHWPCSGRDRWRSYTSSATRPG